MTTSLDEYKLLADITARGACPRCNGFGFVHISLERHDRSNKLRCKHCAECVVCDGSGVTIGVVGCKKCNAFGYIHNPRAPRPHTLPEQIRCFDCINCRECRGKCVIDPERLKELQKSHQSRQSAIQSIQLQAASPDGSPLNAGMSLQAEQVPDLVFPPAIPDLTFLGNTQKPLVRPKQMHLHLQGILGIPLSDERILAVVQAASDSLDPKSLQRGPSPSSNPQPTHCPKCKGIGFIHESSLKHDKKPTTKCKHCTACKPCQGSGTVTGKLACPKCETRGFVHASTERDHDAPAHLRCFFCKECSVCTGTGLIAWINPVSLQYRK